MIFISSKLITRPEAPPINHGAVVIRNGIILSVGPVSKIVNNYPSHRTYRFDNTILLPGLVNVHTHLELPPLIDTIRARTFSDWVLNLIRVKKNLNNKDYSCAIKDNIDTLIHTGTTTVGEICTHGISPSYLKQSGLRAMIFQEVISMDPASHIPRLSSLVSRPSTLLQAGISPHTPYTVSEAVLLQIKQATDKHKLMLSMHIAESKDEIRLLQRKKSGLEKLYKLANWNLTLAPKGLSSFKYLQRIGLLSPNLLAVHAVQASDNDIKLLKKFKVSIAHCPRSNKETLVGRMQLKKMLDAGITVGLGTDSLASAPTLNMWDEMRYAYKIHKKDGITAKDIFQLATFGGAKALGMDTQIGTLEPGKKADLIVVPLPKKDTGDIYSDLLRETKSCIMSVVNGKVIHDARS